MKKLLGIMFLVSAILAGCGNDKPVSMEDMETYIKSKDKTYKKLDINEFEDAEKAREQLEENGVEKFVQYDSESGMGSANIYKYKNEELAKKHSQKTKENKADYNNVHYRKGQYVLVFWCRESEDVFKGSCPNYDEKFKNIEKELGKADYLKIENK